MKRRSFANEEALIADIQSGKLAERLQVDPVTALRFLMEDVGLHEDFLVVGIVHYIERELERRVEDAPRDRERIRRDLQRQRERLSDPEEARRSAERQNRMKLHPDIPDVRPEEVLKGVDEMEQRYAPPVSLDEMKAARQDLDAWRSMVMPILDE